MSALFFFTIIDISDFPFPVATFNGSKPLNCIKKHIKQIQNISEFAENMLRLFYVAPNNYI